jgi:beta-glucosidase
MASKKMTLDQQVADLLNQMTLHEKISLLAGKDVWNTVPVDRLGIPSITMTDGPHGVRAPAEAGRISSSTTCFPTGVSMAASWNTELVGKVGQAIAEETRGMGCDIILGPCVNIVREPRAGRNFEAYSEDPFLAGKTAVAFINGVQSKKVGTSLKHYAANNHEIERGRSSSEVDERTLREIYLAQFEMAVKESRPWTVMCSYNRINGVYASQHDELLNKILKEEWGFEGLVVSDWGANHTIFASVNGGLDLEMPGPAKYYGRLLGEAIHNWQIDEAKVNEAARRVLRIVLMSGRMDGTVSKGAVNTPEHQKLARQLAEEAITLLKNDGEVLPVEPGKVKTIAVIGPNAADAVIEGGGSSHVEPFHRVSPLEALHARLGKKVTIEYEQGCDNFNEPPVIPLTWLTDADGNPGMKSELFRNEDFTGAPVRTHTQMQTECWWWVDPADKPENDHFATLWTGNMKVPISGKYHINLGNTGQVHVYLDGELFIESKAPNSDAMEGSQTAVTIEKDLVAGKTYALRIEHKKYPGQVFVFYKLTAAIQFKPGEDPRQAHAIELAKKADVVLFFAGYPEGYESEGGDRPDIEISGGQNALIAAVAQANPRTVVILNAGAPVSMPWLGEVAGLVEAFYPGQENGNAVADVLLGKVNPSGKLPVTFPKRLEDNPAFINAAYPGCREVLYGEGIFVGYRYYDKKAVEPLFPFGYGLSYTTFEYSKVKAPKKVKAGQPVEVSVTITNTGKVAGKEIVQLYVADPKSSLPRPPKELKGFVKVELQPGESQLVTFVLDQRALSFYDPHKKQWVAEPGDFELLVGASSRDIRGKAVFQLKDS